MLDEDSTIKIETDVDKYFNDKLISQTLVEEADEPDDADEKPIDDDGPTTLADIDPDTGGEEFGTIFSHERDAKIYFDSVIDGLKREVELGLLTREQADKLLDANELNRQAEAAKKDPGRLKSDQPDLSALPLSLKSLRATEPFETYRLSSARDFKELKEFIDLTSQPEWKDVYIIGWRTRGKGIWNLNLGKLFNQVTEGRFGNIDLQIRRFAPLEEWTDEYLIKQPKEQLLALAGYRHALRALLTMQEQHLGKARTQEQKSLARQLVLNEAKIWDKALKTQGKWTARKLVPHVRGIAKGRLVLTPELYKRLLSDLKKKDKKAEAPPPPVSEHPSVQLMDNYVTEGLVTSQPFGPNDLSTNIGYAWDYFAARRLGGRLDDEGEEAQALTGAREKQEIRDSIDDFFPDLDIWEDGDRAIWGGIEVELVQVHDYVDNKVTNVVIREVKDVSKVHTVLMSELTQPSAQMQENIRAIQESAAKAPAEGTFEERLEKISVGPAPSRTLRIGRGAKGQVPVVFQSRSDADLFSAVGRMRRKMQGKEGPRGPSWKQFREMYPEGAENIGDFSQTYRDQIMAAIKDLPEGEAFDAPRPSAAKPLALPPPPLELNPLVKGETVVYKGKEVSVMDTFVDNEIEMVSLATGAVGVVGVPVSEGYRKGSITRCSKNTVLT